MSRAFLAIPLWAAAFTLGLAVTANSLAAEPVELFAAAKAGDLEVRFIPRDDAHARLILKNNTAQPISVKLPEVFAASPVLAQQLNAGNGFFGGQFGQSQNSNNNSGSAQTVGASGNRGISANNGIFSIPPEKTVTVRLATVCLEYGKPTPKPSMQYAIRPIEEVSSEPELYSVLKQLGTEDPDQRVIQAAAWHYANDMSWEKLAGIRNHHLNGISEPFFARRELDRAKRLEQAAKQEVAARKSKQPAVAVSVGSMASLSER
jgi:hypothetical protein